MRTSLLRLLVLTCTAGAFAVGCGSNSAVTGGTDAGTPSTAPDADGDGISDDVEGTGDLDGDGIADFQDDDVDGDGISDAAERGPNAGQPLDSDRDGTPDYRDTDSDGNGIPDSEEGTGDPDGDQIGNWADLDNDGDGMLDAEEIAGAKADCNGDAAADATGTPVAPNDCDGDGTSDHLDTDSDGDGIPDASESTVDTDGDEFLDRYDLDSDGDGIPDATEGQEDPDGDFSGNFRDPDSDDDGISDAAEVAAGTNPVNSDSDGDGVSDLVEVAAGTNALDGSDNPRARGDFVFLVPWQGDTAPAKDTLEFKTSIQFADVYFTFDTTGSMSAELSAMRSSTTGVPAIVDQLRCTPTGGACQQDDQCQNGSVCFNGSCITDPLVGDGCIPDLWTGVGRWDELNTYRNLVSLQPDPVATANAVPGTGGGADEAPFQPPACIASPSMCPGASNMNCKGSGVGCPGFRQDAVRVYVQITDADDQCSGSACGIFTAATAGSALQASKIKFVSLYGTDDANGTGTPESVATDIALASGTVDSNGDPFVYLAVDSAVVQNAVSAIRGIARGSPLDVTVGAADDTSDAVDATQFIDYLEVNTSGSGACTNVPNVADTDADQRDDSFPSLLPGIPVCWDLHPVVQNTTVQPTLEPQLFRARIIVSGDGSPLDERDVFFLVPPKKIQVGIN
jgi:Bacterial TSP3 repeat